MGNSGASSQVWPELNYADWKETCATLHMWTQIVGKIRLKLTPWINHSWHVTFYLTARGLTTSPIPHGTDTFEIRFDFIDHQLRILKSDGAQKSIELKPRSVADFYKAVMSALDELKLPIKIDMLPNEIPDPIPFDRDDKHRSYDPEYANRFWRVLAQADRVFKTFRARFCGKCSPVHFFWGSFDLAVTRFSGRHAPERPGADSITREAYSHEVSSVGFWPGSGDVKDAAFYSYSAPEPSGFRDYTIQPGAAHYNAQLSEFILMYDDVRRASSPSKALVDFCQSSYEAAAKLASWDRQALERPLTGAADAA